MDDWWVILFVVIAVLAWSGLFPSDLAIQHRSPIFSLSDIGRTIGSFRFLALPGARSDFLTITSTNRVEAVLLHAFAHVHLQQSRKVTPMVMGTVKFYNDMKGFGFIQPNDGSKDVFVHATALERAGMRGLVEGQKVAFDTAEDRRSGKIAVNNIETA
jgi:cold shock protein